jgi:Putative adhesin
MPKFETPQPIAVTVDVFVGHVEVIASDRTDSVVEVRPSDPAKKEDVRAAQETAVDFAAGHLTVQGPRGWKMYVPPRALNTPSVDVTIEVPTGSRLHGSASVCRFLVTGELGQCELKNSVGDMQLEQAGPLELNTSGGNVTVDRVVSRANITTGTGIVRIREIDGSAVVKNSNGDSTIGEVAGDLQVNTANGNITVERPRGSVTAKTANGNIRIGDASRGTLQLETSVGELEVGIHAGSAAFLDVSTKAGTLQNLMESAEKPAQNEETVHVYARSSVGNIIIRRATAI